MLADFILRLVVAGLLGAIIGLDREIRAKEAGFRTHFLVSLGSALIMIVSQYGFSEIATMQNVSFDPSRVAAQVVSGIGFIGAGTIIIQKKFVRGLTNSSRTLGHSWHWPCYWCRYVLGWNCRYFTYLNRIRILEYRFQIICLSYNCNYLFNRQTRKSSEGHGQDPTKQTTNRFVLK